MITTRDIVRYTVKENLFKYQIKRKRSINKNMIKNGIQHRPIKLVCSVSTHWEWIISLPHMKIMAYLRPPWYMISSFPC